jgi:predicted metal-dependent phosphoesterase TrpH
MDLRVDLHLHTCASDGRWTPEQLVEEVRRAGIGLFAVTDHDSLGSLAQTARLVRGRGPGFLPGVELSSRLDGQILHLLAYGFDPADVAFASFVVANEARLTSADDEAVRVLIEAGYPISYEDYAAYRWDRGRGGWKSYNFLVDRGFCRDVSSYFERLFGADLPHPQPDFPAPEEVIAAAHRAGAVVILAHPGARFYNGLGLSGLDRLVEMGVQGLECHSFHHDEAMTRHFLDYCRRRDLLVTGGSDCHGGFVARPLGVPALHTGNLRLGMLAERIRDLPILET